MKEFAFDQELWLPRPPDHVFPFFANARNLEALTPAWLRFKVLTPEPIEMRAGMRIEYLLRVHGIPLRWRTEIDEWSPPHQFVDRQLQGPYRLWHHTHRFEEQNGGTLCTDLVRYRPRGGALVNRLFVRRDIERIFAFRRETLQRMFDTARPTLRVSANPAPRK